MSAPEVNPMDHAAAHERLADLALEPGAMERLLRQPGGTPAPDMGPDASLLAHLGTCQICTAELDASGRLDRGLRDALSTLPNGERLQAAEPPAALRTAILAAAGAERRAATPGPARSTDTGRRAWPALVEAIARPRWAGAIAAVLIAALLGGVAGSRIQRLGGEPSSDSLVGVVSTVERILESPTHRVVPLRAASGAAAGSVAWSRQDFAVLASSLAPAPGGQVYRCWLVWAGQADEIGEMDFAGSTAYWTGTAGSWASVTFEPGTRFEVTLESGPQAAGPVGPAVLSASLDG